MLKHFLDFRAQKFPLIEFKSFLTSTRPLNKEVAVETLKNYPFYLNCQSLEGQKTGVKTLGAFKQKGQR